MQENGFEDESDLVKGSIYPVGSHLTCTEGFNAYTSQEELDSTDDFPLNLVFTLTTPRNGSALGYCPQVISLTKNLNPTCTFHPDLHLVEDLGTSSDPWVIHDVAFIYCLFRVESYSIFRPL